MLVEFELSSVVAEVIHSPAVSGRKVIPKDAVLVATAPVVLLRIVTLSPATIVTGFVVILPVVFVSEIVTTSDVEKPFFWIVKVREVPTPGAVTSST